MQPEVTDLAQLANVALSPADSNGHVSLKEILLPPAGTLAPITACALLDEPEPTQPNWIWNEFLPEGALAALVAKPKVGKTTLSYELAVKVAQGLPFLGRPTQQGAVLVLAVEEHRREIKRRIRSLGGEHLQDLHLHIGCLDDGPTALHLLAEYIKAHAIKLVIFDTLNSFWSVQEENDASAVTQAIKPLLALARDTGAAVLLIHHARKSEGEFGDEIRGSGALFSLLDVALILKRHEVDTQRKLTAISRYPETPAELILELRDHGYECLGDPSMAGKTAKLHKLEAALTREPADAKAIAKKAGVAPRSAYDLLEQLALDGRACKTGEGRRNSPFVYSLHAYREGGPHETKQTNGEPPTNPLPLTGDSFRATPHSLGSPRNTNTPAFVSCAPRTPDMKRNGAKAVVEPCFTCHGGRFWVSVHGATVCETCHPPMNEELVKERIKGL